MQEYMTVREVSDKLRTSPPTIYEMIRIGKLTAIRIGRTKLRIARTDFEKFIETQSTGQAVLTA